MVCPVTLDRRVSPVDLARLVSKVWSVPQDLQVVVVEPPDPLDPKDLVVMPARPDHKD